MWIVLAREAADAGQVAIRAIGEAAVQWQLEFDNQSAVRTIFGSDGAAVEADSAISDGKPEAGTAGGTVA